MPAEPWRDASTDGRHLALISAAARKHGQDLVLLAASAALVHGLPVVGRLPKRVQALRRRSQRGRTALFDRHCYQLRRTVGVGGVLASDVATTCVDLARADGLVQAVCAMDHALRERMCTKEELDQALADLGEGNRGVCAAESAVHLADPLAESPGESLSRVRMWQAGLPRPSLQISYDTRVGVARTDFVWAPKDGPVVVGEFDGMVKYHRETAGVDVEEAVYRERQRERALEALGFVVARWTWAQAWYDEGSQMLAVLAEAGIRPTGRRW